MKPARYLPPCLLILSLSGGCAVVDTRDSGPAPVEERPGSAAETPPATPAVPAARPQQPPASNAYQPLLDKAATASARGDYDQALALLERAQRIDPDSAEIYLAMARTHHASGDTRQAKAVAERGLLYCSGRGQCDALRNYTR